MRAAEALEKSFLATNPELDVKHLDTLDYTNKVFRHLYSRAYLDMVNKAPEVMGWLYDQFDKPWKNERRRLAFDKLNTRPFVKLLQKYDPDITVCTHFLPCEIISWLKAKKRFNRPQAIVVTDFDVHAMWLCHHYEQYFVAMEETRVHLSRLGIEPAKITTSGIPIDPLFSRPKDKIEMRLKHGLAPDLPTVLISAGGFGVGPLQHLITELFAVQHRIQAVAICGRNEELRKKIDRLVAESGSASNVSVKVIGFTREMDELMAASDILLGKPGGLTTSEALARGLVFVIVNPIPGQEERNSDHLLEQGAAIRCNNLPVLAWKIDKLLDDPIRLAAMKENVARLARPAAAETIVRKILRGE